MSSHYPSPHPDRTRVPAPRPYAERLTGGHPNSLGDTVAVEKDVLPRPACSLKVTRSSEPPPGRMYRLPSTPYRSGTGKVTHLLALLDRKP
jgi:hypothetical protein